MRRQVFFVPGFDPFPARRYRELYRREMHRKASLSPDDFSLLPRIGVPTSWMVQRADRLGTEVSTRFDVLDWSDLVASRINKGVVAPYRSLCRVLLAYSASSGLLRLFRQNPGTAIVALYPVLCLVAQLLFALVCAWIVAKPILNASPVYGLDLAMLAGAGVFWLCLRAFRYLDRWLMCDYLINDFAYFVSANGAMPPELVERTEDWAHKVEAALRSDCGEVLVIGHSAGVQVAAALVARCQASNTAGERRAKLGFVSLGHSLPMVTVLPNSDGLRSDLARLGSDPDLFWLDVSAPGDPCSFPLCDPVETVTARPRTGPLLISAAFSKAIAPDRWRQMRFRFLRRHVQYLCAYEHPADYDYFDITTGDQTLAERYADRSHSPSASNAPEILRSVKRAA